MIYLPQNTKLYHNLTFDAIIIPYWRKEKMNIKKLIIPLFIAFLGLILASCNKVFTVAGDLDVLDNIGYEYKRDANNKPYFNVKPGTQLVFNINPEKLDKSRELKQYEIIKGDITTHIQSGQVVIADNNIIFKVVYQAASYVSFKLTNDDKEIYNILNFTKLVNNKEEKLDSDDFKIENNRITSFKKGLNLRIAIQNNHPYLVGKELISIRINNQDFTDFSKAIDYKVETPITLHIASKDLQKIKFTFDEAQLNQYNIKLLNDLTKTYQGDLIKLDLTNLKHVYKEVLTGIKINNKLYSISNEVLSIPSSKDETEIKIELVTAEEIASSIISNHNDFKKMFKFFVKRNNQNDYEALTDLSILYKGDAIKIETNPEYRNEEANITKTTSLVKFNNEEISTQNNLGENSQVKYETILNQSNTQYNLDITERELEERKINIKEASREYLKAIYRGEEKSSFFNVYPYQKVEFQQIKNPEDGQVVEKFLFNNEEINLVNGKYIVEVPNTASENIAELVIGNKADFAKLQILDFYRNDHEKHTLLDNQQIEQKLIKKNQEYTLSLNTPYYKYSKILVNGHEVDANSDTYKFSIDSETVIEIKKDYLAPFKTKITLNIPEALQERLELTNIQNGENLLDYFQEFSIGIKNPNQYEFFQYHENDELKQVANNKITFRANFDLKTITINENDFYELAKITYDYSKATQAQYLMNPTDSSFKKLNDNEYFVRKNYEYTFKVEHISNVTFYKYILNNEDKIINANQFILKFNNNDKLVINDLCLVQKMGFNLTTKDKADQAYFNSQITNGFDELKTANILEGTNTSYNEDNKAIFFTSKGSSQIYVSDSQTGYIITFNIKWYYTVSLINIENNGLKNPITNLNVGYSNLIKPIKQLNITSYSETYKNFTSEIITEHFERYITENLEYEIIDELTNKPLLLGDDYTVSYDGIKLNKDYAKITIKYSSSSIASIKVSEGYNAYTQADMYQYFGDPEITKIFLLRSLKLKADYTHTQTSGNHPDYLALSQDPTINENLRKKYELLKDHSNEKMLINGEQGSYFKRIYTDGSNDIEVNGNGFTIDAKETPFPDIKSGSWAPGGEDSIADVDFAIFAGYTNSDNSVNAITTIKNIKLIGNTFLPDNQADPASTVSAWASGGLHGVLMRDARLVVDNLLVRNTTIGVQARGSSLKLQNSIFDENWANSVLFSNAKNVFQANGSPKFHGYISKAEYINNTFKQSGGAAIFNIDFSRGRRGDLTPLDPTNGIKHNENTLDMYQRDQKAFNYTLDINDPISCSSYSYDPELYYENNTFENWIDGTSSYYRANKIPADQIIANLEPVFKQLNAQGIKKSHVKKINGVKKMNFAIFYQNPAITLTHTDDYSDLEKHSLQAFDIYYKNTDDSISRTYRTSHYKNYQYLKAITSQSGLIFGHGYNMNKGMEITTTALGVNWSNLNNPAEVQKLTQAYGLSLIKSLTNLTVQPGFTLPDATEQSQRFFELHMAKFTPTLDFACFPVMGLVNENVPD